MSAEMKDVGEPALNTQEIITLTARLAEILAEEVDLLSKMQIKEIETLQKEKQFITSALEAHKRILKERPQLSETIPSQDRSDLEGVVEIFNDILEENHRRLLRARDVNRKIVDTITEVVKDNTMSHVYDDTGIRGGMGSQSVSITLNQTA